MKITIIAASLLLATPIPVTAGHYSGGGGPGWGAVAGAGILGRFSALRPLLSRSKPSSSRPRRRRRCCFYGVPRWRGFTAKFRLARRNGSRCRCGEERVRIRCQTERRRLRRIPSQENHQ